MIRAARAIACNFPTVLMAGATLGFAHCREAGPTAFAAFCTIAFSIAALAAASRPRS